MAVAQDFLPEVTRRLVETFQPDKVILFGSTVWGTPSGDSDLDLLVVVADSQEPPSRRAQQAHRCLRGLRVACDILVRTRDELDRATRARSSLLSRVIREGRALYG
jgi:predicted nucleotidyltransferase